MTREHAKELLPIIQAFAEGKTIQYRNAECEWENIPIGVNLSFADAPSEYRIKPESKYRPFKSQKECWNEMHRHPDFGWVKYKEAGSYAIISIIYKDPSTINMYVDGCSFTFPETFEEFEFTDGTPFGIKEE